MDDADRAQLVEEREREAILARHHAGPNHEPQCRRGHVVVCCDCWRALDPERLRANPEATRCLLCQTLHEKRQPRPA